MPVVFDRYLRGKADEDATVPADGAEEDAQPPGDSGRAGAQLRRVALGVAVGAAIGWLLGRKGDRSATRDDT